jgi:DNA-binding MarR family transcriptional regulator
MSLESYIWATKQVCGGPIDRLVLIQLCDDHHKSNFGFAVHLGGLAKACEMTVPEITESLGRLEGRGLLVRVPELDGCGERGDHLGYQPAVEGEG